MDIVTVVTVMVDTVTVMVDIHTVPDTDMVEW